MRKRITSLFLALALCLTMLPTTALAVDSESEANPAATAEGVHIDHPICGGTSCTNDKHSEEHAEAPTWTEWTDDLAAQQNSDDTSKTAANSLPTEAGSYYLTGLLRSARHGNPQAAPCCASTGKPSP